MLHNIFKVAIRNFLRQPGHSLLSVLGLAVSFSAALIIGLWVYHETSFDRFHSDAANIFKVMSHVDANGTIETYHASRANTSFESIPEVVGKTIVITGTRWPNELCFRPEGKTNECNYLFGVYADESLFTMFNFNIVKGDKNPLAHSAYIAISQKMAKQLFGDEDPLGKIIKLDDHFPVTVASVFENVPVNSSLQFEFALPRQVFATLRGMNANHFTTDFFPTYIKTNISLSKEYLTEKLNESAILTDDLKKDKLSYSAFPLVDDRLRGEFVNGKSGTGRILYVQLFSLVAVLVVAMAIINFINLSTARAGNRAKEIGIRKVTGANRGSLVFQFIGESFFVVVLALVVSLLVTQFSLPLFNNLVGEQLSISLLNPSILGWIGLFLIVVALAAGLYPALVMSGFQPAKVLKGATTTRNSGAQHLRKVLLVVQVAASLGIVVFTGVLFLQLRFIQTKNLGMDSKNMVHIEPTYKLMQQYSALKNELLANPKIKHVAASNANPVNLNSQTTGVKWPGMPEGANPSFKVLGGTYELPEMLGLTLREGRLFKATDKDSLTTEVLVTEGAIKVMGIKDAVGSSLTIGQTPCTIIGVVNDFYTSSLKQEQLPVILYKHDILQCSHLYVKYAEGTTADSFEHIEEVYNKLEPAFTMKYAFADDTFNKMYKTERTASKMLVGFTSIALVIAVIGIVGLATFNVLKRKKEIGIKRVFGASVGQILNMLSREFIVLIFFAAVVAFPLAWYGAGMWLSGFAYRIDMPWWIFGATLVSILGATILLIAAQGWKTIRTNPTEVLRNE